MACVPAAAQESKPPADAPASSSSQQSAAPAPQESPAPQETPAPQGKVLFERHASPDAVIPPDSTQQPAVAGPDAPQEISPPAASSTVRRRSTRRGLQRRDGGVDASTAGTGVEATGGDGATPPADGVEHFTGQNGAGGCVGPCDAVAESVTDAERAAPVILDTALDLHLNLQTGRTDARAKLLVRNAGAEPLRRLALQVSSSLQWQSARLAAGAALTLHQHRLLTDADHTGAATELVLQLPQAVAAGGTVALDLFYGGTLGSSAERLLRMGAPADRAALADWDAVSDRFTALRGFGNVLWLPTAAPAVLISQGGEFAAAVGAQRRAAAQGRLGVRLTVETTGVAPGTGFLLGHAQPLVPVAGAAAGPAPPSASYSSSSQDVLTADSDAGAEEVRLYTAEWPLAGTEGELPSLLLTAATPQAETTPASMLPLRIFSENTAAADMLEAAGGRVRPLLEDWLGARPVRSLNVVELPLGGAQPYSTDGLLVESFDFGEADPATLALSLVYPLAQAWIPADAAPWMREGLPEFLTTTFLERTRGRDAALVRTRGANVALTAAETGAAAGSSGASLTLADCADALCARTKGAAVFAMLRQMVGDAALKQAISGWLAAPPARAVRPAAAAISSSSEAAVPASRFEQLLEATSGKDLRWFFADWVDRDAGLPDLAIVNVAPRRIERGTVSNIVPSEHRPVGGPIGSLPVPQPGDPTGQESATTASRGAAALGDGSWLVAVEVQNNGGAAAEVPVTVRGGGLQNSLPLRVPAHGRATVRVPFETAPEEVTVNDGTTPEARTVVHRRSLTVANQ